MKGILDRFEDDNQAVILIEEIQKALVVPLSELPQGSKENTYFHIEEKGGDYKIISIDYETTKRQARKSEDLLAKLRAEKNGSKYKRG